jgi:hypothetical protein
MEYVRELPKRIDTNRPLMQAQHHLQANMDPRAVLRAAMFGPVQVPRDHILGALIREIEEHRVSSYYTFDLVVHVQPALAALGSSSSQGLWVGYNAYEFVPWSRPSTTYRVRVSSTGNTLVL